MLKTHLSNASKGIFIGLTLSIVFSFLNSPSTYMPLSPSSGVWTMDASPRRAWIPCHALLLSLYGLASACSSA